MEMVEKQTQRLGEDRPHDQTEYTDDDGQTQPETGIGDGDIDLEPVEGGGTEPVDPTEFEIPIDDDPGDDTEDDEREHVDQGERPDAGVVFAVEDVQMKFNNDGSISILPREQQESREDGSVPSMEPGTRFWAFDAWYIVDSDGTKATKEAGQDESNATISSNKKANTTLGANSSKTASVGGGGSFEVNISIGVDEFLECADTVHKAMENSAWGYCNGRTDHGPSNGHTVHGHYGTLAAAEAGRKTTDCSTYVCWVLQAAGVVPEGWRTNSEGLIKTPEFEPYLIPRDEVGEVQPGDILLMSTHGKNGHAQINGEDNLQYNCGGTSSIRKRPYKDTSFITNPVGSHGYEYVLRLFDSKKKDPEEYKGYKGNDAVVSPVTGVLLEYGVYNNEDETKKKIDSITEEAYRVNVDLKYGQTVELKNYAKQIVSDNVGYAKILVLDQEYYQKLEQKMKEKTSNAFNTALRTEYSDKTLLAENGKYRDLTKVFNDKIDSKKISEKTKDWNEVDKTLYGYKEFAESYEKGGIAGYVIYIDGFLPELPDPDFSQKKIKEEMPYQGKESERTKNTFTTETVSGDNGISFRTTTIASLSGSSSGKEKLKDKYLTDDKYKLMTKSETNKSNAEIKMKKGASSSVYFQCESIDKVTGETYTEDVIILKEGTIIGRTMTDLELMTESRKIRTEKTKYVPTSVAEQAAENGTQVDESQYQDATFDLVRKKKLKAGGIPLVIGNYLRIIMRDTDTTPVEDVEDYMKLDKITEKDSSLEKLMTWQAFEPEGFHYFIDGTPHNEYQKDHLCIRKNTSDSYGYDWVICDGGNSDPNLCPGIFMGWPGKSPNFGGAKTMEVTGYSYDDITDGKYDTWVTGTQLFEIYTAELEHEVDTIKRQIKKFGGDGDAVIDSLNQDQINALIDVVYKGQGYMNGTVPLKKPYSYYCQATLLKKLAAGKKDKVDLYDFYDTNRGHPRRRVANYYMYKEGIYLAHVNNCSYAARFTEDKMLNWKTRYDFLSETPFQDLMRGIKPTEETEEDVPEYTMKELTEPTNPI